MSRAAFLSMRFVNTRTSRKRTMFTPLSSTTNVVASTSPGSASAAERMNASTPASASSTVSTVQIRTAGLRLTGWLMPLTVSVGDLRLRVCEHPGDERADRAPVVAHLLDELRGVDHRLEAEVLAQRHRLVPQQRDAGMVDVVAAR